MSVRCPEGHLSESQDYCDTCGAPIGASGGGAAPAGPDGPDVLQFRSDDIRAMAQESSDPDRRTVSEPLTCPHCGAANVADALFCEACGYDFTTGTPPMGSASATPPGTPSEEGYADASASGAGAPIEVDGSDGREEDAGEDAAEEDAEESVAGDDAETAEPAEADDAAPEEEVPDEADESGESGEDVSEEDPQAGATDHDDSADGSTVEDTDRGSEAAEAPDVAVPDDAAADAPVADAQVDDEPVPRPQRRARHTPPSRALAEAWVVELWIDPDWYAVQQTAEAIPSPGVPDTVLLTRSSALIGRPSGSLGARPEVDAGADSAVSRRHAQLTSDGQRWWIEDLDSSNGTFVGTVGEPLPSRPITPGQRVEIDRDDRVYLGAWTRLVLRQATASEQRGTG